MSQNKFCYFSLSVSCLGLEAIFNLFYYALYLDNVSDEIILISDINVLILTLDICNTYKSGYFIIITYNNVNSQVLIMQLV